MMSCVAGLNKSCSVFRKSTDFCHFLLPRSVFKVNFLNLRPKFWKILDGFPEGGCQKHCAKFWTFFIEVRGGTSRFASRRFPETVIVASCNLAGRPFVACHIFCIVFFSFPISKSFWFVVPASVSAGCLVTYNQETATFEDFLLFWTF